MHEILKIKNATKGKKYLNKFFRNFYFWF